MARYSKKYGLLGEEQGGLRSGYNTLYHIFSLKCIIDIYLSKNKILFTVFIDYRKSFDNIWRISLWRKLLRHNFNGNIFDVKIGISSQTFFYVMLVSDRVRICLRYRFPFFTMICHSLFYMRISDDHIEVYLKLYLFLYADDTIIMAECELQAALNASHHYCTVWKWQ